MARTAGGTAAATETDSPEMTELEQLYEQAKEEAAGACERFLAAARSGKPARVVRDAADETRRASDLLAGYAHQVTED